jgi:hypothetical protein
MRIDLAEFGSHGCPRSITIARYGGQIVLAITNEQCGTCDREGSTLWIGSALAAHRAEINTLPESTLIT